MNNFIALVGPKGFGPNFLCKLATTPDSQKLRFCSCVSASAGKSETWLVPIETLSMTCGQKKVHADFFIARILSRPSEGTRVTPCRQRETKHF